MHDSDPAVKVHVPVGHTRGGVGAGIVVKAARERVPDAVRAHAPGPLERVEGGGALGAFEPVQPGFHFGGQTAQEAVGCGILVHEHLQSQEQRGRIGVCWVLRPPAPFDAPPRFATDELLSWDPP